jgi:hydroxyacylglutathione hydrolase
MKVIQLAVGGFDNNYSYLVLDENNIGVLIDPTGNKEIIENAIKKYDAKIILQLLTHRHPDHIENVPYFKEKGIPFLQFEDFVKERGFMVGSLLVRVIFTPGHTSDSVCFKIRNNLFTGDTLFVQGVGTTAYGGNEELLSKSLQSLFELNQEIIVWPGHNYGGEKATLATALANAHLRPSKDTIKKIHKKVDDYNLKQKEKFDKPSN